MQTRGGAEVVPRSPLSLQYCNGSQEHRSCESTCRQSNLVRWDLAKISRRRCHSRPTGSFIGTFNDQVQFAARLAVILRLK